MLVETTYVRIGDDVEVVSHNMKTLFLDAYLFTG